MGKHRDKQRRKANGARKRNAQSPNAKWRSQPASESQWNVLRKIGRETGQRFAEDITRGQASEVIGARFEANAGAHRRSQRAQPKRGRRDWADVRQSGDARRIGREPAPDRQAEQHLGSVAADDEARPAGHEEFVAELERLTGTNLTTGAPLTAPQEAAGDSGAAGPAGP